MDIAQTIEAKYLALAGRLDEATLRLWVATEARSLGRGGVSVVARAAGVSRTTVYAGLAELDEGAKPIRPAPALDKKRVRAPGGGRKTLVSADPTLLEDLDALVEPTIRGDPLSPLRWTCKSTTRLAQELNRQGHRVSQRAVCDLLAQMHYSLRSVRKTREGARHPDRDAQLQHIATTAAQYQRERQPVISVDTKKKALIGDLRNAGREWQPAGQPEQARTHDFIDEPVGMVAPYGVFDGTANEGWVRVGIDHDTAECAVQSVRRWWLEMGRPLYRSARRLLITADCGGSNGSRPRLWHLQLQHLADDLGLTVQVCHFPPGTSKWNEIEHRMFCHITNNWRGRPLLSRQIVVSLIGRVTTAAGLRSRGERDQNTYAAAVKVTAEELARVSIERDEFHGEWNYSIKPHRIRRQS